MLLKSTWERWTQCRHQYFFTLWQATIARKFTEWVSSRKALRLWGILVHYVCISMVCKNLHALYPIFPILCLGLFCSPSEFLGFGFLLRLLILWHIFNLTLVTLVKMVSSYHFDMYVLVCLYMYCTVLVMLLTLYFIIVEFFGRKAASNQCMPTMGCLQIVENIRGWWNTLFHIIWHKWINNQLKFELLTFICSLKITIHTCTCTNQYNHCNVNSH